MEKNHVEVVARAIIVLTTFLTPPHRFGVSELSKTTGFTKNQTFRLLQTLAEQELVVKDPETKEYSPGFRLIELGAAASRTSAIVQAADPILDELGAKTGETINLIVRANDLSAVCIAKRDSRFRLQITGQVGTRFPLHAGSTPKLLLAYSTRHVIDKYLRVCDPLPRFTPWTITDPAQLLTELEDIRRQGYAVSDEDMDLGAWTVAGPIRDQTEAVTAGVSIALPVTRAEADVRRRYIDAIQVAAQQISQRLQAAAHFAQSPVPGVFEYPTMRTLLGQL